MKIITTRNYQSLSRRAAQIIWSELIKKPDLRIALPTGATPLGLYQELRKKPSLWQRAIVFNLDELVGYGPRQRQSFFYFLTSEIVRPLGLNKNQVFFFNGLVHNWRAECQRMTKLLKKFGPLDLVVLGLGLDGHLAFNEPNTSFSAGVHRTKLSPSTIEHLGLKIVPKEPLFGLTIGLKDIMAAKKIILLVHSSIKTQVMVEMLKGQPNKKIPASILKLHPNVLVIIDRQVSSNIRSLVKSIK